MPTFSRSINSIISAPNPDINALAKAINKDYKTSSNTTNYCQYLHFKSNLKAEPATSDSYRELKRSGALANLKHVLGLHKGTVGAFREYKRAVKQGAVLPVNEYKHQCSKLESDKHQLQLTEENAHKTAQAHIESGLNEGRQIKQRIEKESETLAKKMIDELADNLNQKMQDFNLNVEKQLLEKGILSKVQNNAQKIRFVVEGHTYTVNAGTIHKHSDFLSAIANTELKGDRTADGAIELKQMTRDEFDILYDFHRGIMPQNQDLPFAKETADTYCCDKLSEYCDKKSGESQKNQELKTLKRLLVLRSLKPVKIADRYPFEETQIKENPQEAKELFLNYTNAILHDLQDFLDFPNLENDKTVESLGCFKAVRSLVFKLNDAQEKVETLDPASSDMMDELKKIYSSFSSSTSMRTLTVQGGYVNSNISYHKSYLNYNNFNILKELEW